MKNHAGIILDVDGTLVDSNDAHARAWVDALAESGRRVPFEVVRPLIGMGADKLLPRAAALDAESPAGEKVRHRRQAIFKDLYLPHVNAFAGARPLVQRLLAEGLTVAVASSAGADELQPLLDRAGVLDLIDHSTSSGDAGRSKPDPDIVHAAMDRTGLAPGQLIMIGDTPYDIEAAGQIGIATIALRCGGRWSEQDLVGAVAIYNDPEDLLIHFDESPIATRFLSHA